MKLTDLHEYQKRLANFIAKHPRSIISVDMGLGKTAAVLAWLDWYVKKTYLAKTESATRFYTRMPFRVLIIAPKRVAENNWLQEAKKWGLVELHERMTICCGTAKKRALCWSDDTKPIKICSRDNFKDYSGAQADVLILDELTSYKSPDAGRSKAVQSISAQIKVGLTGTFLANGAIDIYGQAAAVGLAPDGLNFYAWRATYFRDALAGSGLAFSKWRLSVPLEAVLKPIRENVFTLTAADYLQIPEVTHNTHAVEMDAETRKAIEELDAFLSTELNGEVLTFDEKQKFAKLQTLCNGFVYNDTGEPVRGERSAKLEAVADFVADCKDAGERVLLFYAFREEYAWLCELLKARGVHTYDVSKKDFVEKWNEGEIDCLIAHPASAGHGLNLQHGGRVIVWSTLTYNYELFAQGNARLARQGQRQNVQIHYFVAADTCEENAVRALRNKQNEQNEFLKLTKQ
ncbi:MAG: DEAD/DEAH box helicase [Bacteroidaceae bacterium]|nr:DEAD/DEAH box helicase [Bacteroidaceae bacterium]